jgi:hypothetical protein
MFWISHAMNELTAELNGAVWDAAASSVIRRAARYCAAVASVARTL